MSRPVRTQRLSLYDQVLLFMRKNLGEFTAQQVAEAINAARPTIGTFLLGMTEEGRLDRRMSGPTYERKYRYWAVRPLPPDVSPLNLVGWYSLPVWIKGSYQDDVEMYHLQSLTWVKVDEDVYHSYDWRCRSHQVWAQE